MNIDRLYKKIMNEFAGQIWSGSLLNTALEEINLSIGELTIDNSVTLRNAIAVTTSKQIEINRFPIMDSPACILHLSLEMLENHITLRFWDEVLVMVMGPDTEDQKKKSIKSLIQTLPYEAKQLVDRVTLTNYPMGNYILSCIAHERGAESLSFMNQQ